MFPYYFLWAAAAVSFVSFAGNFVAQALGGPLLKRAIPVFCQLWPKQAEKAPVAGKKNPAPMAETGF